MKKLILILIVLTAIISGCKYEDGPFISFRSVENRLYGMHNLTKYTVNGEDSLSLYNYTLGLGFYFFYNEVTYNSDCIVGEGSSISGYSNQIIWTWKLTKNKKNLEILTSGGASGTGPFGSNKTPEWEILKLKANDIKLKTNYNGKEYQIELE
jgi:hypothetical protein